MFSENINTSEVEDEKDENSERTDVSKFLNMYQSDIFQFQ